MDPFRGLVGFRPRNGGKAEWRNGGMAEWQNGRMAEWRNGGTAEWRNGGMAQWQTEWQNGGMADGMIKHSLRVGWRNLPTLRVGWIFNLY